MVGSPAPGVGPLRSRVLPELTHVLVRSVELGFLGGMPVAEQIDHALGFVAVVESLCGGPPSSVVDLGTGGGVPGLVLVSCWPECRIVLADGNERRTEFLREALEAWPTDHRAVVVRGRAEELGRDPELRESFVAVTSRSFGIPAATAECGSAFLSVGGRMVVSEPPDAESAQRWPQDGVAQVGLVPAGVVRPDQRFGYQVLEKTERLEDRYPRRVGVPTKRPLF